MINKDELDELMEQDKHEEREQEFPSEGMRHRNKYRKGDGDAWDMDEEDYL